MTKRNPELLHRILANPRDRRKLFVGAIVTARWSGGDERTEAQAEAAYDRTQWERHKGMKGKIDPDSPQGQRLGFTSDKFAGYLWGDGDRIWISAIMSLQPEQGNFSRLLQAIEALGYSIAVADPLPKMLYILQRKGFKPTVELIEGFGEIPVWVKLPPSRPGG